MEELKIIVSKNILFLRTQNQMTQFELGEKLNYSDKTISKWERAESIPDAYILKKMSKLFYVSVDYLLTDHGNEQKKIVPTKQIDYLTITKISIIGIWTLAIFVFIMFWMFDCVNWMVFVYTLPISLIVLLVLNSIWGKRKNNFYVISALAWSIIAAVYLSFLQYNMWLLFFLGVPSQIIIHLCFKIKKKYHN